MSSWNKYSFQDPVTPIMEQLIMFNDHAMMIIIMITMMVMYMILSIMTSKFLNKNMLESQMIELVWTITPAFMLILIALPSLKILYLIEEINNPLISIKAIGHQWYWSYEYSDFKKIEFDSYMKPIQELKENEMRLLETDNHMITPFNMMIRLMISSTDVIHSWTIPSMGLKIDATPGRINQGNMMINRPGVYYGQCSEICGSNHSFMPITLESISMKKFMSWMIKF
uniref:cytochrome c oxidase subunit II n=1 Tax=Pediopsoides anchorides TaxID=3035251 RepID=UPI0024117145|nr:cytochrome c oxidase subunit II [Pediopsoides anchorides]WEP24773.1 cytochrome c oxidase subunit II [Pediopsoides anchorides]